MSRCAGSALALVLLLAPALAPAAESLESPGGRWRVPVFVGIDSQPLKAFGLVGAHFRDVYRVDRSPLLDGLYLDGGVDAVLTPSNPGVRVQLEWMPLAIAILKVSHSVLFYTAFPRGVGHGLSFDAPDAPFGADVLRARSGEEERLVVQRPVGVLVLRAKLWRVSAQNELELAGWYVPPGKGSWWYEAAYDLLVARGRVDATVMDRTFLLFEAFRSEAGLSLSAGVINEYARSLRAGLQRERLGAGILCTLPAGTLGARTATVGGFAGTTLVHPSREGAFWAQLVLAASWEPGR